METEVYAEIHSKKKKTLSFALGHQAPTMCMSWRGREAWRQGRDTDTGTQQPEVTSHLARPGSWRQRPGRCREPQMRVRTELEWRGRRAAGPRLDPPHPRQSQKGTAEPAPVYENPTLAAHCARSPNGGWIRMRAPTS